MRLDEWIRRYWKGTEEELAKKLGISRMHLWRLKRGAVKKPTWETVERIKEVTNGMVTGKDLVLPRKSAAGVK